MITAFFRLYFLGKIMWSFFFSHFIKIFLDAFIICFEQMVNLYICVVARVSSLIYILSWYTKISSYFTIKKLAFSLLICKLNLIFILNLSCSLIIFSNINLKWANLKDGELCNCQRSFVWKYSRLEVLNQVMKQRKIFKATQCIWCWSKKYHAVNFIYMYYVLTFVDSIGYPSARIYVPQECLIKK